MTTSQPHPDLDTLYVLTEAANFLAEIRLGQEHLADLEPTETLHLLSSLVLQAHAWMPLLIHDALTRGHPRQDVAHALGIAYPDPQRWLD